MIHIVGSGPGDPGLITVKGMKMLNCADAVLYAGSTVAKEILDYCSNECLKADSAGMTLEEIIRTLCEWNSEYETVVRLHSGDPAIFGAIDEEIRFLSQAGVKCDVIPGISTYSALAAYLGKQLTVPGTTQSVLITRFPGKTPVPENLDILFSQQPSAAVYLSGSMGKEVIKKLREHYPSSSLLTIGHMVSRMDQRIETRTLKEWEEYDFPSNLTIFLIRKVSDTRSKLYDPDFSHEFRRGKEESQK